MKRCLRLLEASQFRGSIPNLVVLFQSILKISRSQAKGICQREGNDLVPRPGNFKLQFSILLLKMLIPVKYEKPQKTTGKPEDICHHREL